MKLKASSAKLWFAISRFTKRIWFRSFIYAVVGVATAFVALFARDFVPSGYATKIGADAVGNILTILASSMLAVATFSLSIMVTAFGNASTGASPRASKLLIENQSAQRAVATFIGAFLYSIVGIIALTTGAYGDDGRFVLFLVTIVVIVVIVVTLIKWVDQLATLGRVGSTIEAVEEATFRELASRAEDPYLGGRKITESNGQGFVTDIFANEIGFVALIDTEALQEHCEKQDIEIAVRTVPGSFTYPGRPLASIRGNISALGSSQLSSHFVIERSRTFSQDPRFGFVLLSEIASKALSPGINDPGTAIEVLNAAVRLFTKRKILREKLASENSEIRFSRVFVPEMTERELIGDVIHPIARDGAGLFEIGLRIQKILRALSELDVSYDEGARYYSALALQYSYLKLELDMEKQMVKQAALV
ncbi:MAG: DUF2254 domain-containing protein [Proteobacteria bacterium]|nr:MAG: DUF2254 domain-containing protein [Pseudomonadota bacterium]